MIAKHCVPKVGTRLSASSKLEFAQNPSYGNAVDKEDDLKSGGSENETNHRRAPKPDSLERPAHSRRVDASSASTCLSHPGLAHGV